jgi:hypothetical protein
MRRILLSLSLLLLVPLLTAPHYSNWHAFSNGEVADAEQVNENFVATAAALDDFEVRITTNAGDVGTKQDRVTGTCPAGSSIASVSASGGAGCNVHLGADSVGTSEVGDNTLTADDLAPSSVGASEVIDGSLTDADIGTLDHGLLSGLGDPYAHGQYVLEGGGAMLSELIINPGDAGDARIYLKADQDNNDESDNPSIHLSQDAGLVNAAIALIGNSWESYNANSLIIKGPENYDIQFDSGGVVSFELTRAGLAQVPSLGSGNVTSTESGTLQFTPSSRRFKKNIETFEDDFGKIFSLRPVTFEYKEQEGLPRGTSLPSGSRLGYVAEEAAEAGLDLLVATGPGGQAASFSYDQLPIYTVEVLRAQRDEVSALREKLSLLEDENEALSRRLDRLESQRVGSLGSLEQEVRRLQILVGQLANRPGDGNVKLGLLAETRR